MPPSRKHYYTVLLDRTLRVVFLFFEVRPPSTAQVRRTSILRSKILAQGGIHFRRAKEIKGPTKCGHFVGTAALSPPALLSRSSSNSKRIMRKAAFWPPSFLLRRPTFSLAGESRQRARLRGKIGRRSHTKGACVPPYDFSPPKNPRFTGAPAEGLRRIRRRGRDSQGLNLDLCCRLACLS